VTVVEPEIIKAPGRPTIASIESALDDLPATFRCSRGWLIGARYGNADAFGCGMIFDDRSASERVPREQALSRQTLDTLEQMLAAIDALDRQPALSSEAKRWLDRPLWTWEDDPGVVFRRLLLLARLHDSASQDLADTAAQELAVSGPLHDVLGRALVSWARSHASSTRMPAAVTHELVRRQVGRHGKDAAGVQADLGFTEQQLDPDAMVDEIKKLGVTPSAHELDSLDLGISSRVSLWEHALERSSAHEHPALLEAAWSDVDAKVPGGLAEKNQIKNRLATFALACHRRQGGHLSDWRELAARPAWRALMRVLLQSDVRERLQSRDGDWAREYVEFGGDRDCAWLTANRPGMLEELVESVLTSLPDPTSPISSPQTEWLLEVSGSPLRLTLPLDLKLRVASKVGGSWAPLLLIERLWNGEHTPVSVPPILDGERAALDAELTLLAASTSLLETPPNLSALKKLLQRQLNPTVIAAARSLMPEHADSPTTAAWVSALRDHIPQADISSLTRSLWLIGPVPPSELGAVRKEQIADLVKDLLTRPSFGAATHLQDNLMALARAAPTPARGRHSPVQQGMLAALKSTDAKRAADRLMERSEILDALVRLHSREDWYSCVALIAAQLADRFVAQSADRFRDLYQLLQSGNDISQEVGTIELLACLRQQRFKLLRGQVATLALGPSANDFDEMLRAVIAASHVSPGDPDAPKANLPPLKKPGIFSRWWRWMGTRIPWIR
jgi:hypothetical protein